MVGENSFAISRGSYNFILHYTKDLIKLINEFIPDKCDLVITMNLSVSLIKRVIKPDALVFFNCAVRLPDLKRVYVCSNLHFKLYSSFSTNTIFSTSNLSNTYFYELSLVIPSFEIRSELDKIVEFLKEKSNKLLLKPHSSL